MFFYVFLLKIKSKYFKPYDNEPLAIIPLSKPEQHIVFDRKVGQFFLLSNNNKHFQMDGVKINKVNNKISKMQIGGVLMCFMKNGRKLVRCENDNAKGSNWIIKKKKGDKGWMIKNDKESGFWTWSKEWCLSVDGMLEIVACNKKDKKQRFKIVKFNNLNIETKDGKEDDELGEENDSNNVDENEESSETSNSSNDDDIWPLKTRDQVNYENGKTNLESELEKIKPGHTNLFTKKDLLAITNNHSATGSNGSYDGNGKLEVDLNLKNEKCLCTDCCAQKINDEGQNPIASIIAACGPRESIDIPKIKTLIEIGERNKNIETDKDDSVDSKNLVGKAFEIKRKPQKRYDLSKIKRDKNLEFLFGVSNDPSTTCFNPLKAAALKMMVGIDQYLENKKYDKCCMLNDKNSVKNISEENTDHLKHFVGEITGLNIASPETKKKENKEKEDKEDIEEN